MAFPIALAGGGTGGFGGGEGGGFGGGGGLFLGHGFVFGPAWLILALFLLRLVLNAYHRDARRRRADGRPPLSPATLLAALTLALLWPLDVLRERRALPGRVRRVRAAAAEASADDERWSTEAVHRAAEALFRDAQRAWSHDDRDGLARIAGPTLLREWDRRLDDFARRGWRNEIDVQGELRLDHVGLARRGDPRTDTVCVRVAARVRDVVRDRRGRVVRRRGSAREAHRVVEWWTLGTGPDGGWIVVRIEQRREGLHQLREPIVATPWAQRWELELTGAADHPWRIAAAGEPAAA